jgi:hypothetical protein
MGFTSKLQEIDVKFKLQKCAAIYLPCNFEVNPITHFEL